MSEAVGYIRVFLPRYPASGQRKAMESHSIPTVIHEGKQVRESEICKIIPGELDHFVRMAGDGRLLAVQHLFLLGNPKVRGRGEKAKDLWATIRRIEAKGAILWELSTGRRSDDRDQRDEMIEDAVVALAKGRHKRHRGDKRRGRPKAEFTAEEWQRAFDVWHSRKIRRWKDVDAALPKGFTRDRAYEKWGARDSDD
jgi:hypothetical protein